MFSFSIPIATYESFRRLFVLVLFNGVLFYKLWTLEQKAAALHMHRPLFPQ
jgi:hypothetical protein